MFWQCGDELCCAGQRVLLVHQDTVHISQPRFDRPGSLMGVIAPPSPLAATGGSQPWWLSLLPDCGL